MAATMTIGAPPSVRCRSFWEIDSSDRVATTRTSTTIGGPIHTGQVRNAAVPAMANIAIAPEPGRSSHVTRAHHITTANVSDTT